MYKSQFQKIDLNDWFCGPMSQILDAGPLSGFLQFLNEVQRRRTNRAWPFQHDYVMCEDVHIAELEQAEHLWLKSII